MIGIRPKKLSEVLTEEEQDRLLEQPNPPWGTGELKQKLRDIMRLLVGYIYKRFVL